MEEVVLTAWECRQAVFIGSSRHLVSKLQKRKDTDWMVTEGGMGGYDTDIEAAAGEMAVAKYTGRYWDGSVDTWLSPDVSGLGVRHTKPANYKLIVRPRDPEACRYVLVTGQIPTFTIVGWLFGHEARNPEWWEAPHDKEPAWFVPQSALRKNIECLKVYELL